jgi:hypothetical protein
MPINFPIPTFVNESYTFNTKTWIWNGNGWVATPQIGYQGFQGFQGYQGDLGYQGDQGSGYQGFQGFQGYQGDLGYQGEQGSGYQGFQGFQGYQGDLGYQGEQGSGYQGDQGFQGHQGYQGDGFITTTFLNQTMSFTVFSFDKNDGSAIFVEYFIVETGDNYYRGGTMVAVWDKVGDTITMNELTTNDLNGSTSTFVFSANIISTNVIITAAFTVGIWSAKLSARII